MTTGLSTAIVCPVPLAKVSGPLKVTLFEAVVPPKVSVLAAFVTFTGEYIATFVPTSLLLLPLRVILPVP